jgi:ubiquinone/menaquinone biosynthesis C-methylase UbiE
MKEIDLSQKRKLDIKKAYPVVKEPVIYVVDDKTNFSIYYFKKQNKKWKISRYKLNGLEADIWLQLKGKLSTEGIITKLEKINRPVNRKRFRGRFYRCLSDWNSPKINLINLLAKPVNYKDPCELKHSKMRRIGINIIKERKSIQETKSNYSSYIYHKEKIANSNRQFERIERTLSHTLKDKNVILDNKTYGEKFADVLFKKKRFHSDMKILEIGGGLGWLGFNVMKGIKLTKQNAHFRYIFLDLSPILLNSQRRLNKGNRKRCLFSLGDACSLGFKDNSFNIVIANECIADFPVIKLARKDIEVVTKPQSGRVHCNLKRDHSSRLAPLVGMRPSTKSLFQWSHILENTNPRYAEAVRKFNRYIGYPDNISSDSIFPLGIVNFLEEIKRTLKRGGLAVLVEYGDLSYKSSLVKLRGHFEYSVDFKMVKLIAKSLGFKVEILNITSFLQIKDMPFLSIASQILLNKYLQSKRKRLKSDLYTRQQLKEKLGNELKKIKNLEFISSKKTILGFNPNDFKVMLLRNPF